MVRNDILDPCFEDEQGETAVCPLGPWSRRVVVLDPVDFAYEYGPGPSESGGPPWALELNRGEQCEIITGATGPVGNSRGRRYGRWSCLPRGVVIDGIDRGKGTWRVRYYRDWKGRGTRVAKVVTAWR